MICLIDDHDFESLLSTLIDLLCLCDFFKEILHHNTVIVPNIRRRDLEMVYGGHNVEFEFAITAGLKHSRVNLDLLDTRSVELLECCNNACFLAGTRGTVDKEMWEITTLCLFMSDKEWLVSD